MADVTQILAAIEQGDAHAPEQLLPLVYDELRRLAAEKLVHEQPGQTLQATALVHQTYLRLLGGKPTQDWDGRRHFFAAAAEAMRRILIDRARHKQTGKAGGGRRRLDLDGIEPVLEEENGDRLVALDEALRQFEAADPRKAELSQAPVLRRPHRRAGSRRARRLHLDRREGLGVRPKLAPGGDQPHVERPALTGREKSVTSPGDPQDFHDITSGTSTGNPHYSAGPGYDYVTGLGSPMANLVVDSLIGSAPTLYVVTSTSGSPSTPGSLPYVVAEANANTNPFGSVISFDPSVFSTPQTIDLASTLVLSETRGPEVIVATTPGVGTVTVNGMVRFGVIEVNSNTTAELDGLTISDGSAIDGGGIDNAGTLTLTDVTVSSNTAAFGGGIYNDGGEVKISGGCTIASNSASGAGGGIYQNGGAVAITGGLVILNAAAEDGGGVYVNGGSLTITGGIVAGNTAGNSGGGVFNDGLLYEANCILSYNDAEYGGGIYQDGGAVAITGGWVEFNAAAEDGGGIYNSDGDVKIGDGCDIATNSAGGSGGGIYQSGGAAKMTIIGGTLGNNTAFEGGGICVVGGSLTITVSTLSGNTASFSGGGIDNDGGDVNISDGCSIANNSAGNSGGGIYHSGGTVTINSSTLANNTAGTVGGGICVGGGSLTITASTLAGNTAGNSGGGVFNDGLLYAANCTLYGNDAAYGGGLSNEYQAIVTACTISGNSATNSGGGIDNIGFGVATLTDTIVAGNNGPVGPDDIRGSEASQVTGTYNLIGDGGSGGISNHVDNNIVLTSLDDLDLGPLANNGGPTETTALLAGSAAIGAGTTADYPGTTTPITTDQRRSPLDSPPDIGAWQRSIGPALYVVTSNGGSSSTPGTLAYVVAEANSDPDPYGSIITFDPMIFGTPQTIDLAGTLVLSETPGPEVIDAMTPGVSTIAVSGMNRFGVIEVGSSTTVQIEGLTISDGSATYGGGIDNAGTLTLTDVTLSGNIAGIYGGGIDNAGTLTLTDVTLSGNIAALAGGGISNSDGTVTIIGSTLKNNTADGHGGGGGIFNNGGTLTLKDCTLTGNSTVDFGGAIFTYGGSLSVSQSTVAANTAGVSGGGIEAQGTTTVTSSTFTLNSAGGGGGAIDNYYGNFTVTLEDSIFSGDSCGDGPEICNGVVSLGYNLVANTANSSGWIGSDVTGETADLGTLGDYGGPTETIPLLPGSPALGAGRAVSGITTDQRGEPLDSPPDIGAFQSQGFTITTVNGSTPQQTTRGLAFTNPLAVIVTANNPLEPVAGGTVTFTAPSSGASAALEAGRVTIGSDGSASVIAADNSIAGSYTVTASLTGAASVSFSLTNLASAPVTTYTVNSTSGGFSGSGTAGTLPYVTFLANINANSSSNGTEIEFDPSVFATPQTITLSATLILSETAGPVAIDGPGSGLLTISGGGTSRVFEVDGGVTASLSGLTISGGSSSLGFGGGLMNYGTMMFTDCTVSGNTASFGGGGLANYGTANLTMTGCTVSGNTAYYRIFTGYGVDRGTGGGVLNAPSANLTLTDCTLSGNSAYNAGGGMSNYGTANLTDCTISGNSAASGGNSAYNAGGGMSNYGTANLTDCTISGNSAAFGGGIFNENVSIATNSTIADNSATTGDGLANEGSGVLTVTACTVSGNTATNGGGLYNSQSATATLTDTIVAGNSLTGGGTSDIIGRGASSATGTDNLVGTGGSGGLTTAGNNLLDVSNPLLAPLGNYGGPTETMALLPGSPALGAGIAIDGMTTDQRGEPLASPPDIGAFQSQGFTITTVNGSTPQTAVVGTEFANPLAVVVTASNPLEPVAGGIVTFSVPSSGASAVLSTGTATIGADGVASVTATADTTTGSYAVTASAAGATAPASFALTVAGYDLVASGTSENLVWYGTSGSDEVQFAQTATATVQITVSELGGVATSFTATVSGVTGAVVVNEYDVYGASDVINGGGLTTIPSMIIVGNGNDTIIGGGGANTIVAGDGNNTIYGNGIGNSPNSGVEDPSNSITVGNGDNIIYGNYSGSGYQGGNNTITAGDGNNTIYGNYGEGGRQSIAFGEPFFDGAEGSNNTIKVGNGDNTIYGNYGTADGGEGGSNTIIAGNGNDVIYGNAGGSDPQRLCGSNFIQVGNGNDTIYGNFGGDGGEGGNNTILTGSGQDTIYGNFGGDGGEGGNNLIVAGGGNDTIYAHCALPATSHTSGTTAEGKDLIIGGSGTDTIYGWPAGYSLGGNTGDLFVAGTTNLSLCSLDAVLAEWDSSDSYATRVADLSGANGPVGANGGNYLISGTTVLASTAVDQIFGTVGSDDDWYLVTSDDQLNNVNSKEVTLID